MGLAEVIGEVNTGGERRAQEILEQARGEADAILEEARRQVAEYAQTRAKQADADAAQLHEQHISHAEFESRKQALVAENGLRSRLRTEVLAGFADLPTARRKKHLSSLLKQAKKVVPKGKVWGNSKDKSVLSADKAYSFAGTADIAGGLIVESPDGQVRLDLSYETLLAGMWRDVLRSESDLFA